MHRAAPGETLTILVVTEDRVLQRQLAQFFDLIGYHSLQAADREAALAAVAAQNPPIMLLDADLAATADWELCRQLSQRAAGATSFKVLLAEEPDESQLQGALEAGIDDVLVKPISFGELLSRLRSAARVLEFDRRAGQQGRVEPLTGLLGRSAFVGHLRRQLSEHAGTAPRVACIVLDVDFFARINRLYGATASDAVTCSFAQELNRLRVGSEVLGCLGGDRFCAMLPGANEAAAAEWADKARAALAAVTFKVGDETIKLTASFGVTGCEAKERAEQLIDRATQAMQSAKTLGRNCVVKWSQHHADAQQALDQNRLFEHTVLRDVMTPCTIYLRPQETVAEALELCKRTRLDDLLVVDGKGHFLGVCQRAELDVEDADSTRQVLEVMATEVKTFGAGDSLASLMEYFTGDVAPLVVVLEGDRPVGFVTCNSLVALSRPVTVGSLAADAQYRDTSDYLLVPDVRPLEAEPVA